MLTVSRKVRYALRALHALAQQERVTGLHHPVLIAGLAESERIPRKFLEGILLDLRHAGLLHSKKGRGGGYALARPAEAITVGDVVRALDGPLAALPCARDGGAGKCDECPDADTCGTRLVMRDVKGAMERVLDATSLADVLRRTEALGAGAISYSI